MTTPNLAGGARFGVRSVNCRTAAFLAANSLPVCAQAVAKRVRHERARCMKAAASRRTPKRLRRPRARQPTDYFMVPLQGSADGSARAH